MARRDLSVLSGVIAWTTVFACNESSPPAEPFYTSVGDAGPGVDSAEGDGAASAESGTAADSALAPVPASVAVGAGFACVIARDATVWCWGRNDSGQLGRDPAATPSCGASRCSPQPVKVDGISDAVRIAAGDEFACVIGRTGYASCWGSNAKGQLATREVLASHTPRQVIARAAEITAAGAHACVITTDGFPHCWGENTCEIFGSKEPIQDVPRRVPNVPMATHVSIASDAMCAVLPDETALCWGVDRQGSLGHDLAVGGLQCNGSFYDPGPRHVQSKDSQFPLDAVADVHAGEGVTCARKKGGQVLCWGDNRRGAVGQGFPDSSAHPRPLEVPALIAKKLEVRGQTACVVTAERVLCWGDGQFGQLDTLSPVPACANQVCRALPYVIPGMMPVRELAVGPGSIATIKTDLSVWMWGRNGSAELGLDPAAAGNQPCPGQACVDKPRALTDLPALE